MKINCGPFCITFLLILSSVYLLVMMMSECWSKMVVLDLLSF